MDILMKTYCFLNITETNFQKNTDEGGLTLHLLIYISHKGLSIKDFKKVFPRKIKIIGCLKYDIFKFKRNTISLLLTIN